MPIFHQLELSDQEVKILVTILKYSMDYCPIESISNELSITSDELQDLITKLEKLVG
jgi:hypothetical protein